MRGVEKVIVPKVSVYASGQQVKPMSMKLIFSRNEDAAEVVEKVGQRCKLEIRAAVQRLEQDGNWSFHGHSYVLEAMSA